MSFLSTVLLIPASAIGAGLLSFPVLSGLTGVIPSSLVIILCWAFSTFTSLTVLELTFLIRDKYHQSQLHFFTLNQHFLPSYLRIVGLCLFLFMCYGSLLGYADAIAPTLRNFHNFTISDAVLSSLCILCLFGLNFLRKTLLRKVNDIFTPLMLVAFVLLLVCGLQFFQIDVLFKHTNWLTTYSLFPSVLTAFSFQFIVPTLANIMNTTKKQVQIAILIGTSLNCLIYLFWNTMMLGCVPYDQIKHAYNLSVPITTVLSDNHINFCGNIFAIFALFTSFVSIAMVITDYWKDHLKTHNKLLLSVLIFAPVWLISLSFDKLFLWLFSVTGGYGDTILFGILPVYMLFQAKKQGYQISFPIWSLFLSVCMAIFIFAVQLSLDFTSFFR